MNTGDAAEKLGTTQKELRRFLRSDPSYTNASHTTAGRYNFTEADIPTLAKRFKVWQGKNVNRKRAPRVEQQPAKRKVNPEGEPGLPVSILKRKLTREETKQRDEISRARVVRLEAQLMAAGNHLSQMTERDFRAV